jgi:hypothetical protein
MLQCHVHGWVLVGLALGGLVLVGLALGGLVLAVVVS